MTNSWTTTRPHWCGQSYHIMFWVFRQSFCSIVTINEFWSSESYSVLHSTTNISNSSLLSAGLSWRTHTRVQRTPDGPGVSRGQRVFNVHLLLSNYYSRIAVKHTSLRLHRDTHKSGKLFIVPGKKNTHTLTHINAFQREFSRFDLQAKLVNTPRRALTDTRLHMEEKF